MLLDVPPHAALLRSGGARHLVSTTVRLLLGEGAGLQENICC